LNSAENIRHRSRLRNNKEEANKEDALGSLHRGQLPDFLGTRLIYAG
jgi:hypothetical protein